MLGYVWLCWAMLGYAWLCLAMLGYAWLCLGYVYVAGGSLHEQIGANEHGELCVLEVRTNQPIRLAK